MTMLPVLFSISKSMSSSPPGMGKRNKTEGCVCVEWGGSNIIKEEFCSKEAGVCVN